MIEAAWGFADHEAKMSFDLGILMNERKQGLWYSDIE